MRNQMQKKKIKLKPIVQDPHAASESPGAEITPTLTNINITSKNQTIGGSECLFRLAVGRGAAADL
jgi:hypothetical protein